MVVEVAVVGAAGAVVMAVVVEADAIAATGKFHS
jgi:hypothetical protein